MDKLAAVNIHLEPFALPQRRGGTHLAAGYTKSRTISQLMDAQSFYCGYPYYDANDATADLQSATAALATDSGR